MGRRLVITVRIPKGFPKLNKKKVKKGLVDIRESAKMFGKQTAKIFGPPIKREVKRNKKINKNSLF